MSRFLGVAREARAAGLHPIPIKADGSKAPTVNWQQFQERAPTDAEMEMHFCDPDSGIALVLTKGTECLDFDAHEAWDAFVQVAEATGLGELVQRVAAGYLERTPRGYHLLYRCETAEGNQKLASRGRKAIIETRGLGGYIIAAPSDGPVHETGKPYVLVSGGIPSIVTLTTDEREDLLTLARSLGDREVPAAERRTVAPVTPSGQLRPGDDFVQHSTWAEVLEPHGWKRLYTDAKGETYWRRPGKSSGQSATTNYAGSGLLYVFTTSTEFEAERGYNRFSAYALLNHGGDFVEAASELAREGYGERRQAADYDVDLSGLSMPAEPPAHEAPRPPSSFPRHLLEVPGMVGELTRYITTASAKPQPILALGAALASLGAVYGRKVQGPTGMRTNLYALGLGETGCGKEATRSLPRRALRAAGLGDLAAYDDMASDAAINQCLTRTPSCVFMLDEIGRLLREVHKAGAKAHTSKQIDVYLKLYGVSAETYYGKHYGDAQREPIVIEQPNVCIWGTSVPSSVWASMTSDQVANGFLSRLLVFESEDPDPTYRAVPVAEQRPPAALVAALEAWRDDEGLAAHLGGDVAPEPRVVPHTQEADQVFAALEADMRMKRAALRAQGEDHGLFTRVSPAAAKMALIRAAGRSRLDTRVDGDDARWACELATYLVTSFHARIAEHVVDSEEEARKKLVLRWLAKCGGLLTRSQLTRKTQALSRRERDEAIADLVEAGLVVRARIGTGGRPREAFALPEKAAELEEAVEGEDSSS